MQVAGIIAAKTKVPRICHQSLSSILALVYPIAPASTCRSRAGGPEEVKCLQPTTRKNRIIFARNAEFEKLEMTRRGAMLWMRPKTAMAITLNVNPVIDHR